MWRDTIYRPIQRTYTPMLKPPVLVGKEISETSKTKVKQFTEKATQQVKPGEIKVLPEPKAPANTKRDEVPESK